MSDGSPALLRTLAEKADARHSALLVIDVQNDFVASGGFFDKVGGDVVTLQRRLVPNLLRLIDAARLAGVQVIFVQAIYDPEFLSDPMRERNARLNMELPRCLTGSWGAEFYQVRPLPGEPVIIKHRYSAMVGTPLLDLLGQRGIRSLLLAGVASEDDHRLALKRFNRDYGQVVSSAELMSVWDEPTPARAMPSAAKLAS
jgi:ureidoacrylate peracid hydrolase